MSSHRPTNLARIWKKFYKNNNYYHKDLQKIAINLIPKDASVLEFGSRGGELLKVLPNTNKVGVEIDRSFVQLAKKRSNRVKVLQEREFWKKYGNYKFDCILINHTLGELDNIQDFIVKLKKLSHKDSRIIVLFFNYLWKPILDITQIMGLRMPYFREPNWLGGSDIDNLFYLESFEKVKSGKRMLLPIDLSLISGIINKYFSVLPFFAPFALTNYAVYKKGFHYKDSSVSIVIPAKNEAGNIRGIIKKIPKFKEPAEVIFVEGHSKDNTYEVIKNEITKYKGPNRVSLYKQKGYGKADAVRLGFSYAKNDLLMILDADLTVDPMELCKFYKAAIEGKGELIMGSRLIYPMEKLAMRTLNILGNKFFSLAFTFLLDQRIKDTLCGTKAIFRKDYLRVMKERKIFGNLDPFGDYNLIFGSAKLNLKITEIPIRYKERTYGKTNINRFTHGLQLLKMVLFAAKNFKFI